MQLDVTSAAAASISLMLIRDLTFPKQPRPEVRKPPLSCTQINCKQSLWFSVSLPSDRGRAEQETGGGLPSHWDWCSFCSVGTFLTPQGSWLLPYRRSSVDPEVGFQTFLWNVFFSSSTDSQQSEVKCLFPLRLYMRPAVRVDEVHETNKLPCRTVFVPIITCKC